MALRTRCSECENFTERKEDYQDVSVPVRKEKKDEDDDDDDPHSMAYYQFLIRPKQIMLCFLSDQNKFDGSTV